MSDSASTTSIRTPERVWRRASRCASSGCVEIAFTEGGVAVRDSKREDSPVLVYDRSEWEIFVAGVKSGEFDLPGVPVQPLSIRRSSV